MPAASRSSGNVLFLILIAVALFAALSYAVTNSQRGSGNDAKGESAEVIAAGIMAYAAEVEREVNRLMIINGVAYNQIDFYNLYSRGSSSGAIGSPRIRNPNCTAINATKPCRVFKTPTGDGRLIARNFDSASNLLFYYTSSNPISGDAQYINQFMENIGTTNTDILMVIIDLKKDVCDAINKKLGLPLALTQPMQAWGTFPGSSYWLDAGNYSLRFPGTATAYIGQKTFCMRHQVGGNMFVHALIER